MLYIQKALRRPAGGASLLRGCLPVQQQPRKDAAVIHKAEMVIFIPQGHGLRRRTALLVRRKAGAVQPHSPFVSFVLCAGKTYQFHTKPSFPYMRPPGGRAAREGRILPGCPKHKGLE